MEESGQPTTIAAEFLRQWQAGDPAGFTAAIDPWQRSLFQIMHRILGSSHDAEDAFQTLVLQLWRSRDKIPPPHKLAAWLRRCAVNEAIRCLRQKKLATGHPFVETCPSSLPEPLEELADEELRSRVAAALRELTAEDRAVLTLRFDEGLTIREIAEVLESPPSTIHAQLTRVVARLRTLLGITSLERTNHG